MKLRITRRTAGAALAALFAAPLAIGTALAADPKAADQKAADQKAGEPAAAPFEVKGFRSATFGMTPAQVKAAVAKDFPNAKTSETDNPAERTHIVQLELPSLEPAPGPATVAYIFGATSKTLTHVNVIWLLAGNPNGEQRNQMVAAAMQLKRYFEQQPPPAKLSGTTAIGPNALLIHGAVDAKGAAVEIVVEGVGFKTGDKAGPEPTGPAGLRISYIANAANPDVFKLKPGAF